MFYNGKHNSTKTKFPIPGQKVSRKFASAFNEKMVMRWSVGRFHFSVGMSGPPCVKPRGITGKIRIMCKHTTVTIPPVKFEMEQDCAWMDSELTIRNSSPIGEILDEIFLKAPWEPTGFVGKNGVTNR